MNFNLISESDLQYFTEIIGNDNVLTTDENLQNYASDATENLIFKPTIVLKPTTTNQISKIVKHCNENQIPITPRAAGTGLVGGALPIYGGVLLSVEKLNTEILIDEKNFQVTVSAGVINYHLQEELAKFDLFFPPDPSSWQSSFIGGNIATNAGGPRAVKYGVTNQYVLNLKVVLPNGEIIWTGANTLKNSTGYNLTQLFTGSEGTLGIITKAVLKVLPKPKKDISILATFHSLDEAIDAVNTIIHSGVNPCAIEFMEHNAIEQSLRFVDDFPIKNLESIQAHLLIMFDGNDDEELMNLVEKASNILNSFSVEDIFLADNETEKERIWKLRRKVAEVVKANGFTIEEDTVVPRAEMGKLVKFTHKLAQKYSCKVVCYGHAGDGNLHIRFNHPTHKNSYQVPEIKEMLVELFKFIYSLNGTISGEHGIGLIQKDFLKIVCNEANIQLQKNIKNSIDPNGIMNPGKIF